MWLVAGSFLALGLVLQLAYTRILNVHLDRIGLADSVRVSLRTDRGVTPFWIQCVGVAARACFVAGIPMPLLAWLGWVRLDLVRV